MPRIFRSKSRHNIDANKEYPNGGAAFITKALTSGLCNAIIAAFAPYKADVIVRQHQSNGRSCRECVGFMLDFSYS